MVESTPQSSVCWDSIWDTKSQVTSTNPGVDLVGAAWWTVFVAALEFVVVFAISFVEVDFSLGLFEPKMDPHSESDSEESSFSSDVDESSTSPAGTVVSVKDFPLTETSEPKRATRQQSRSARNNKNDNNSGSDSDDGSESESEFSEDEFDELKLQRESSLFAPFRTVGLVTDSVPFFLNAMGKDSFITTCLGRSWQVLRADTLATSIVSRRLRDNIRALVAKRTLTWAAVGRSIYVWKRARLVRRVKEAHAHDIDRLFLFGDQLISISFADRVMKVWVASTSEISGEVTFDDDFTPTCIVHPHTYLNKVVIGSREGFVEVWNTRTMKKIFRSSPGTFGGVAITCIEQSPALDVLGCGLADGRTVLYNAKFDNSVCEFYDSDAARDGGITCLAFRSNLANNSGSKAPSLVTGSACGKLAVWDLGSRQLLSSLPGAHDGPISALAFLPGQPLLLTAGADNAIRQWIFDQGDGSARLLRHRAGHKFPPRQARYYGGNTVASLADGTSGETGQLLSFGGLDRSLWYMHTMREQQSREVSQGKLQSRARKLHVDVANLKLPPILDLATSDAKQKDWSNIVTVHDGLACARVWSFDRLALNSDIKLTPADGSLPTCCAISFCGNFALVGTKAGGLSKFNLQSGLLRGSSSGSSLDGGQDPITCVVCDGLNRHVITGSSHGVVTYWDLKTLARQDSVFCPDGVGVTHIRLHDDSNLVAVARADLVIDVHDVVERQVVRRFGGGGKRAHHAAITDVTFSPDGAWLLSASAEGSLFVWDIATARCVEWLRFQAPATSISFSVCSSNIATTHVGELGVTVWTNRAAFDAVLLDQQPEAPCLIDLPTALQEHDSGNADDNDSGSSSSDEETDDESSSDEDDEGSQSASEHTNIADVVADEEEPEGPSGEPVPIDGTTITLSAAPPANWTNLSNLDLIRERNRPTAAPQKPKAAPFFLPGMDNDYLAQQVAASSAASQAASVAAALESQGTDNVSVDSAPKSRLLKRRKKMQRPRSKLLCFLSQNPLALQGTKEEQRVEDDKIMQHLLSLTASGVDLEFRTLQSVGLEFGGDETETKQSILLALVHLFRRLLSYRSSFQVVQAYLDLFLTIFHQDIIEERSLQTALHELSNDHGDVWHHLEQLIQNSLCMLQYFGGQQ